MLAASLSAYDPKRTFGGIGFSAKNAHRKVLLLNKAGA
jgi:hypothetical protein